MEIIQQLENWTLSKKDDQFIVSHPNQKPLAFIALDDAKHYILRQFMMEVEKRNLCLIKREKKISVFLHPTKSSYKGKKSHDIITGRENMSKKFIVNLNDIVTVRIAYESEINSFSQNNQVKLVTQKQQELVAIYPYSQEEPYYLDKSITTFAKENSFLLQARKGVLINPNHIVAIETNFIKLKFKTIKGVERYHYCYQSSYYKTKLYEELRLLGFDF